MAIREVVNCDICGIEKQQTNHWWTAWVTSVPAEVEGASVLVPGIHKVEGASNLCGQACAHKWLSAQMEQPGEADAG